jgi:hypothetical protein
MTTRSSMKYAITLGALLAGARAASAACEMSAAGAAYLLYGGSLF